MFFSFTMAFHWERLDKRPFNFIIKYETVYDFESQHGSAALALSCFPQSATAQGNLVFNGGFDTSASGWTLTGTTGIAFYNVKNGNPPGDVVLEGLTASATQTVNGLIAGTSYIVSGDYQGLDGSLSASPNFEVTMNGTILFETVFFPETSTGRTLVFSIPLPHRMPF